MKSLVALQYMISFVQVTGVVQSFLADISVLRQLAPLAIQISGR